VHTQLKITINITGNSVYKIALLLKRGKTFMWCESNGKLRKELHKYSDREWKQL